MPRLRVATPIWLADRRTPSRAFPRLDRDLSVDVAIIGGGVTGAAVAWQFARAGVRVAVLEAEYAGRGSTAASTALLMQEPDKDFDELAGRYGTRAARRIWQLSTGATRDFARALRSLRIACELAARDSVYYAMGPRAAGRLAGEIAARRRAGIAGEWLDR